MTGEATTSSHKTYCHLFDTPHCQHSVLVKEKPSLNGKFHGHEGLPISSQVSNFQSISVHSIPVTMREKGLRKIDPPLKKGIVCSDS